MSSRKALNHLADLWESFLVRCRAFPAKVSEVATEKNESMLEVKPDVLSPVVRIDMIARGAFPHGLAVNFPVDAVRTFCVITGAIVITHFRLFSDAGNVEKAFFVILAPKPENQRTLLGALPDRGFANGETEKVDGDTRRSAGICNHLVDEDVRFVFQHIRCCCCLPAIAITRMPSEPTIHSTSRAAQA